MVRFLRRGHSLDKTGNHQQQRERHLDRSGSDTGEMHESLGNGAGGTPPLPNGRAAAAGAARSRMAGRDGPPSEVDMMKEKFAKLLLGEDMSGTGKGVASARHSCELLRHALGCQSMDARLAVKDDSNSGVSNQGFVLSITKVYSFVFRLANQLFEKHSWKPSFGRLPERAESNKMDLVMNLVERPSGGFSAGLFIPVAGRHTQRVLMVLAPSWLGRLILSIKGEKFT